MPERQHHRTPSTSSLTRRMIRLLEREIGRLEAHYDPLEPPCARAVSSPLPFTGEGDHAKHGGGGGHTRR
jgi:hypothetical protein